MPSESSTRASSWHNGSTFESKNYVVRLIYLARAVRGFGDGFALILLPVYLTGLGYGPVEVGLIATTALLGSAATTLAAGVLARRYPLRILLLAGAIIMAGTGLALPAFAPLMVIAAVVFVGTINPSSGDIGMLVPLEHAALAHEATAEARTVSLRTIVCSVHWRQPQDHSQRRFRSF